MEYGGTYVRPISVVPPDNELHAQGCWYCGSTGVEGKVPIYMEWGLLYCVHHQPASAVVREDAKKGIARERARRGALADNEPDRLCDDCSDKG